MKRLQRIGGIAGVVVISICGFALAERRRAGTAAECREERKGHCTIADLYRRNHGRAVCYQGIPPGSDEARQREHRGQLRVRMRPQIRLCALRSCQQKNLQAE